MRKQKINLKLAELLVESVFAFALATFERVLNEVEQTAGESCSFFVCLVPRKVHKTYGKNFFLRK